MSNENINTNLDDVLVDIATDIELSDNDRRLVDLRYGQLRTHLMRPNSPLAPYLVDEGHIYPQGSVATGTTVLYGSGEQRYDLDALVEFDVPPDWAPNKPLDMLLDALQGFPNVVKIVRCSRCVQLQFATMHMDVTIMDPLAEPRLERAGEIFHSPDKGMSMRIPANPYGFSQWFRNHTTAPYQRFSDELTKRRTVRSQNEVVLNKLDQDALPNIIPPRNDSEQVVALKLMKRFVFMQNENRNGRRPPSIYLAKLALDVNLTQYGLTAQLAAFASHVAQIMDVHLARGTMPDERNPSYADDCLNDRWPENRQDMQNLSADMKVLSAEITRAKGSSFTDIGVILTELFGEEIGGRAIAALLKRAGSVDHAVEQARFNKQSGSYVPPAAVASVASITSMASAPPQHFHCDWKPKQDV